MLKDRISNMLNDLFEEHYLLFKAYRIFLYPYIMRRFNQRYGSNVYLQQIRDRLKIVGRKIVREGVRLREGI